MLFLHAGILIGISALLIPVLLHLLHRRAGRTVDWGAMRFLAASMVTRRRSILLEEALLLALRCVLLTLLVFAAARPFIPPTSLVPWVVVLPLALLAAAAFGASFAFRGFPGWRIGLLLASLVLLALVALLLRFEKSLNLRRFGGFHSQDIALVIDGSSSMTSSVDGQRNFARAVETASGAMAAAGRSSSFSLLVGSSVPRNVVAAPTPDRGELRAALHGLAAPGGTLNAVDTLAAAAETLRDGHNPAKRILVISDGQKTGWEPMNAARWNYLTALLQEKLPLPPQLLLYRLKRPETVRNAGIASITLSRELVGTDREVGIHVTVRNTGTGAITPGAVTLKVEGLTLTNSQIFQLPPGASETVEFHHRFQNAGAQTLRARIEPSDDLEDDNTAAIVQPVYPRLPVLVVEGRPAARALDNAAAFIALALAPGAPDDAARHLFQPRIVAATELATENLERFPVVILAELPRLPASEAARLERFVQNGGGLILLPGADSLAEFYNQWKSTAGVLIPPATLGARIVARPDSTPITATPTTFRHPVLTAARDATGSDIASLVLRACWTLQPDPADTTVSIGGRTSDGNVLLAERTLGKGRVLMLAAGMTPRDSNLVSLQVFVPLVHQAVSHLVAKLELNLPPARDLSIILSTAASTRTLRPTRYNTEITQPDGATRKAVITANESGITARIDGALFPGLHRLTIPEELRRDLQDLLPANDSTLPFCVLRNGEESDFTLLSDSDLEVLRTHVDLVTPDSAEQLGQLLQGRLSGEELWRKLAVAALTLLLLEIALTRWIAYRRRTGQTSPIGFSKAAALSAETQALLHNRKPSRKPAP